MTNKIILFFVSGALVAAISGCTVVSSEKIVSTDSNIGMHYMLPRSNIVYQIVDSGNGELQLNILNPLMMGDPDHSYALRYLSGPTSTDHIKIEVDPKTSLLKTVEIESKDETGDILKKFASTVIRAESSEGDQGVIIYEGVIAPTCRTLSKGVNFAPAHEAIKQYLSNKVQICTNEENGKNPPTKDVVCSSYRRLSTLAHSTAANASPEIAVIPLNNSEENKKTQSSEVSGIFYRGVVPLAVKASFLGKTRESVVLLPDCGPIMSLPLEGQPFVKVKHSLILKDGILQSYEADKPSSALAIVSWPLDVYDAIVETTSKLIQLKIDTSRKSIELERQLLEEKKARTDIGDQLKKLNEGTKPEAAGLISQGKDSSLLLSVKVGDKPRTNIIPPTSTNPKAVPSTLSTTDGGQTTPQNDGNVRK